jgi:hypothetical protein
MLHVTYQTIIRTILRNGFAISDYIDAKPVPRGKKIDPKSFAFTSRVPYFCVFKVRKLPSGEDY